MTRQRPSFAAASCLAIAVSLLSAALAGEPTVRALDTTLDVAPREPITVVGTRFMHRGAPYRFVGANVAIMHGPRHRAALEATLDAVRADGLGVVRVWALGERPADAPSWAREYAFRLGPEGWVEESFVHLDRVLAAARARDLRVIVVLGNRWADYGGAPQYLAWEGATTPLDPAGAPSILALPRFLADPAHREQYRAHLRRVVSRTSSITGVAYRDDPTIFSWELVNEIDAPPRAERALVDWTREMATEIHALDPHHLVGAGHIGYSTQAQRRGWLAVHRLPEIDYADAHAYPTHYDRVRNPRELDDFVDDAVQLAHHVLHKPFVWGEFGFTTRARTHLGLRRALWWERFLARSELDGVDGALAWIYATSTERPHDHGLDVDGSEVARTADVRRVLSRFARRWSRSGPRARNPRLSAARGEAPLWRTHRTLRGHAAPRAPVREPSGLLWSIDPHDFQSVTAESAGVWDSAVLAHVYASGTASLRYTLRGPRAEEPPHGVVSLRMRASSELPGEGEGRTQQDTSEILVTLDGLPMGRVTVPPDDGLGAWVELTSDDDAIVRRLAQPGVHTLELTVPPGEHANGLCLYGDAGTDRVLPPDVGVLPGRLELRLAR